MARHNSDDEWGSLNRSIVGCVRCSRLIEYCRAVGRTKRRAYRDCEYWARPVPNFGAAPAELLIVGLAPAAHGANRTGRMFTGDNSGVWLYRALHRAGLATLPVSTGRGDGLELRDCVISAACHCAPPANRPGRDELINCSIWLDRTIECVRPRVMLSLGRIAWDRVIDWSRRPSQVASRDTAARRPRFAHGAHAQLEDGLSLLGSYHPSQQNTFTGRLTEGMLDEIIVQAKRIAGIDLTLPTAPTSRAQI